MDKWHKRIKKNQAGILFVLPATLLFLVFVLWPFLQALITGFYDYSISGKTFVGFQNYYKFFHDPTALKTVGNTCKYVLFIVPIVLFLSMLISMIIYKRGTVIKGYMLAVFYLPSVVPSVCLAVVWKWLYNQNYGLFNYFIRAFGGENVNFLGDPNIAIYAVMLIVITWVIGQPIVLFTAALGGIPENLLEAASLDGCTPWKRFRYITWHLLKPTTLYVMVTLTINVMQVVEAIQLTTNGGPYYATQSMLLLIYNEAFKLNHIGYATAIGNIMFVIIFIASLIQFRLMQSDVE